MYPKSKKLCPRCKIQYVYHDYKYCSDCGLQVKHEMLKAGQLRDPNQSPRDKRKFLDS